jgi:hypothetical protein
MLISKALNQHGLRLIKRQLLFASFADFPASYET